MAVTAVKHAHYRIEIDTVDAPQHPIVYFRKCGKCTTHKGSERQMERIVSETIEQWRQYSQQIRRYTVSRVPADEVPTN
jgi:DNA-directed RNA polymerase subunit L